MTRIRKFLLVLYAVSGGFLSIISLANRECGPTWAQLTPLDKDEELKSFYAALHLMGAEAETFHGCALRHFDAAAHEESARKLVEMKDAAHENIPELRVAVRESARGVHCAAAAALASIQAAPEDVVPRLVQLYAIHTGLERARFVELELSRAGGTVSSAGVWRIVRRYLLPGFVVNRFSSIESFRQSIRSLSMRASFQTCETELAADLKRYGEVGQDIARRISERGESTDRAAAAAMLGATGMSEVSLQVRQLSDPDARVRSNAIRTISKSLASDKGVVFALLRAMVDTGGGLTASISLDSRQTAQDKLQELMPEAVPAIREALNSDDPIILEAVGQFIVFSKDIPIELVRDIVLASYRHGVAQDRAAVRTQPKAPMIILQMMYALRMKHLPKVQETLLEIAARSPEDARKATVMMSVLPQPADDTVLLAHLQVIKALSEKLPAAQPRDQTQDISLLDICSRVVSALPSASDPAREIAFELLVTSPLGKRCEFYPLPTDVYARGLNDSNPRTRELAAQLENRGAAR